MDSSACGHLSVHQPRSEQSEGQSTAAPRAQLPLSPGDITASQCRSHFKLISLCTMFFKSFLNKTEIQCLFPGVWEQRLGHMCALKKLWGERGALGVHFCSCLVHLLTGNPPPTPTPATQEPQECGRVTVARLPWRQGTGGHGLGLLQLGSSERNRNSTASGSRALPGGLVWSWLFCFRKSTHEQS